MVVGLGNREVTPDALGPKVVDNMLITRHVIQEFGKYALGEEHSNLISSIVPGVMAQTGMESVEIVRGVMKEAQPDYIVAVDALAARSVKRLNRTIQITNTGINPGSGVGNHRAALNQETLGVPVFAIGIPTVVDAATLAADLMEEAGIADIDEDKLRAGQQNLMVTPRDIDQQVRDLAKVVGYGINWALQDLEIEEMNALLS